MASKSVIHINQGDLKEIQDAFKRVGKSMDRSAVQNKVLKKPAEMMVNIMKSNVPVWKRPVHRYVKGVRVATYMPGNLKRAITAIKSRYASQIWIGAKYAKRNPHGVFNGAKVDGWYIHFVEYGTVKYKKPPARPVYKTRVQAGRIAVEMIKGALRKRIANKFRE